MGIEVVNSACTYIAVTLCTPHNITIAEAPHPRCSSPKSRGKARPAGTRPQRTPRVGYGALMNAERSVAQTGTKYPHIALFFHHNWRNSLLPFAFLEFCRKQRARTALPKKEEKKEQRRVPFGKHASYVL